MPPLEDTEHVYAVLEQTHQLQQQPSLAITVEEETQQTMQSQLKQETLAGNGQQDTSDQFKQKERSASWASGHNSKAKENNSSRNMKLELIQIYDSVTTGPVEVKLQGKEAELVESDESLYQNHLRKHSLPASISVLKHSTSSCCSSSRTGAESSHTKPGQSVPVYSVPDMKKKREKRKEREQKTESDDYTGGELLPPERGRDQVLTVNTDNVCLYDEPTSLSLVPKRNGAAIQRRKEEGKDDGERL